MVRSVFVVLSLAVFVAISAGAAHIDTVRTPAHASISKSVHRTHRPAHPASPSRTAQRKSGSVAATSRSHATTRHSTHYASSPSHRALYSTSHSATLRRTRYNRYGSRGHFVPLATVPASRIQSDELSTAPAVNPDSGPGSEEHAAAFSAAGSNMPAETDTLPAPGTAHAGMVAGGNPLSAPREGAQPLAPASGQVAELNRPPIITGRVSSYTLRGTHDSLVRQNERSEDEALERIEDDADLEDRIARGLLVRVPESGALIVNPALPENRRYCRPWTADFLTNLAHAHQTQFHTPIVVSSAVRTVEYQKQLMRINGNAADAEGDIVSPHVTGATIDIAKSGLTSREMEWMRTQLLGYQNAGAIDVEEEFHQRCFHITVYKNYSGASSSHKAANRAPSLATPVADSSTDTPAGDLPPNNQ
jgi:hypothetical protein